MEEKRKRPDYQRVKASLRKLSLEESLQHLWCFSRLVSGRVPLPYTYELNDPKGLWNKLQNHVFPHEMDLFARELILHADRSGRSSKDTLAKWETLTTAFQAIKDFGNYSFDPSVEGGVRLTLHQLAHQQLPRFSKFSKAKIGRYLALYRSPEIRKLFEKKLKIEVEKYFILAFGVIAGFYNSARLNTTTDFSILGIDPTSSERFFSRLVGGLEEMRMKAIECQRLDSTWEYTLNPFHFKPLIALDLKHAERVCCPVPSILERRLLDGIYYDLERATGFSNAFGAAVDEVFGRVLFELRPQYEVFKPEPYFINKARYDGTDWIISRDGHKAFVECKAKRISLPGRVAETLADVDAELGILADAVVQNYANIHREMYREQPEGLSEGRSYNVVMTIEDWFLFSGLTFVMLHDQVVKRLAEKGLPLSLLDLVPYRVLSFEGAQHWVGALNTSIMEHVLGNTNEDKYMGWAYMNYLQTEFPDIDVEAVGSFEADFDEVFQPVLEAVKRSGASE